MIFVVYGENQQHLFVAEKQEIFCPASYNSDDATLQSYVKEKNSE